MALRETVGAVADIAIASLGNRRITAAMESRLTRQEENENN